MSLSCLFFRQQSKLHKQIVLLACKFVILVCFLFYHISSVVQAQTVSLNNVRGSFVNLSSQIDSLNNLCKSNWFSDLESSLKYGAQALELAREVGYSFGEATALNNLGVVYWVQGDSDRALNSYFLSLQKRDTLNEKLDLGNTFHNIGNVYRSQKEYDEAVIWFNRSLKIRKEIGDQLGFSYSTNNLGLIASERGDFDEALNYLEESLAIRKKIQDSRAVATSLLSIGKVQMELSTYNAADNNFKEALILWKSINHIQGQAMTKLAMSQLALTTADPALGEQLSSQALALALIINAKSELLEIHRHRSLLFADLKQYEKAFNEQSLFIKYKDSIFNQDKVNLIQQSKLDQISFEKRLLQRENLLQDEIIKEKSTVVNATIIASVLLLIVVFLLYRVLRLRIKKNRELKLYNDEIERQKQIIESVNENLENQVQDRSKKLQESTSTLVKYSFINSHSIRGPLARLLGLTYLITRSDDSEIRELAERIDKSAKELDQEIRNAGADLVKQIED